MDKRFISIREEVIIMEVFEAIKGRRSVRAFLQKPVPDSLVKKVLESAIYAPSAGNIQPWEFIIVREQRTKERLAEAALGQYFIAEAPVVIVVCANQKLSGRGYGLRGSTLYCIQDTAAATQNILLSVHALGLGACWVGAFREDAVKVVLNIPEGVRPVAIIPVGWPAEKPRMPRKRPLSSVVHYETYGSRRP